MALMNQNEVTDWIGQNKGMYDDYIRRNSRGGSMNVAGYAPSQGQKDQFVLGQIQQKRNRENIQAFPQTLAAMADPYSKQRDQLINDPAGALENSPFFKFMQEKYLNAATAKNAASGNNRSGRGLMALGEASQKASADFMLPYLQSLGSPSTGANAFLQGYKELNPNNTVGGVGLGANTRAMPRNSLASDQGGVLPYSDNSYNYQNWGV